MRDVIFEHKQVLGNGDIIEMRILRVQKSSRNPEGITYSCAYVHKGRRIIGYDDSEGHMKNGHRHHRHWRETIAPYAFVDEWQLIEDFTSDLDTVQDLIKRGAIP